MKKIYFVSHTHWDREWYRPFEYFRAKLVFVMDKLLDILEKDDAYKHFMLDGQTIPLEDYLKIKPEKFAQLARFVKAGRLSIGPWYIQPDEFASDGESLIRNLQIGMQIARKFGEPMMIGYLPDSFGHSGQMPHILKGFGIDSAVVMRGVPDEEIQSSEFVWQAINGDDVIAIYLPHGYSNGLFMPDKYPQFKLRLNFIMKQLEKWSDTGNYLVMNGVDHQFPQPHISKFIIKFNQTNKSKTILHSSLNAFIEKVKEDKETWDKVQGELLSPVSHRVHTSIGSTRIYQKTANRKLETYLENYVEPIAAIAWLNNADYPQGLINKAWKYLIQNQTHDGICGCGTDEVHQEMDQRFANAQILTETICKSYSRAISKKVSADGIILTIFNNAMISGRQFINATVYVKNERFSLEDVNGNSIPYQINHIEDVDISQLNIWTLYLASKDVMKKINFTFIVDFDFNIGYRVFKVKEKKTASQTNKSLTIKDNTFENDLYRLTVNPNGSITLFDKSLDREFKDFHLFEDCGDAGDTYNYSPIKKDTIVTSENTQATFVIKQSGQHFTRIKIDLSLEVPEKLINNDIERSSETKILPITSHITLYNDSKRIDFRTEIDNTVLNHRLRVLFPTGTQATHSFAETQFGTISRPTGKDASDWMKKGWKENPLPIYSQQKFVDLNDGQTGFAVLNRGLPEYEIYDQETIAITLVRGIGMMGKGNLLIRPGRPSGIPVPTPDAQCLGKHVLEYAIWPHAGNVDQGNVAKAAALYNATPLAVQNNIWHQKMISKENIISQFCSIETITSHITDQINELGFHDLALLKIKSPGIILSAVKKAEADNSFIIRIYNATSKKIDNIQLDFGMDVKEVFQADFNEEPIQLLDNPSDRRYMLPNLGAYSAATLKITLP